LSGVGRFFPFDLEIKNISGNRRALVAATTRILEHETHRRCVEFCTDIPADRHPLLEQI
jgi:hypothetical protein